MLADVDREPNFRRIDMTHSFFVGDALGRKGDFADTDKGFAINCGLVYYSPEEFFNTHVAIDIDSIAKKIPIATHKEAIIMVGYPGSGKSTIAHDILEKQRGYVVLSGDKLKTPVKLNREARKYLLEGTSVVYDATNPSEERRNKYIEVLNEMDVPYRIIWVDTDMTEAMRRARLREEKTGIHIPNIAFYVFRKSLEPPTGDNVIKI
jgi:gluconate kinase